jgi:hypothetical protein
LEGYEPLLEQVQLEHR